MKLTRSRAALIAVALAGCAMAFLWTGPALDVVVSWWLVAGAVQLIVAGMLSRRLVPPGRWGHSVNGSMLMGTACLALAAPAAPALVPEDALWAWCAVAVVVFQAGLLVESRAQRRRRDAEAGTMSLAGHRGQEWQR